ncbi:MAG: hypothetical protein ABEI86_14570 [Halobacteriaceae archaeon]
MAPSNWISLIVGGLISGLVGLATVEYRTRRQSKRRQIHWYREFENDAKIISDLDTSEWDGDDASHAWELSGKVMNSLQFRLTNPPDRHLPSTEMRERVQQLYFDCYVLYKRYSAGNSAKDARSNVREQFKQVQSSAESLSNYIEENKLDNGTKFWRWTRFR